MKTNPKLRQGITQAAALFCAALLVAVGTQTNAAQEGTASIWKGIGTSERIDLSGRLHMLSQRIAATSCSLEAGVEHTVSRGIMAGSADEMDRNMNALKNGNPLMKIIGAQSDPRVLANIGRVNELLIKSDLIVTRFTKRAKNAY